MKSGPPDFLLEIILDIHPVAHEALSAFFFDLGCPGVVSEGFEDRFFRAYLPAEQDSKALRCRIREFVRNLETTFPEVGSPQVSFGVIENRDWSLLWRKYYRPLRISEKLTVFPAWETVPANQEGIVIRIEPGPAFGTGEHATTRMCLKAVEACAPSGSWSMLDIGTGSGILALYGALLGAAPVMALDKDPEALRWAAGNLELNNLSALIQLSSTPVTEIRDRFTVVAANLTLGTLLELMPHFSAIMEPHGRLILSGVLEEQSGALERALAGEGFRALQVFQEDEWVCITGTRKDGCERSEAHGTRPRQHHLS